MKKFFLFSKEIKGEGYAPNNQIFLYASGIAGQNLTYFYTANWLRYFCVNLLHMEPLKVGTIFSLSYVWDAVNDPVVGAYIDRRRHTPYKKLRPFLLYLPPLLGVLTLMMFLNTPFSQTGKFIYILAVYFIWDLFYSAQDVGLWGLIALSSPYSSERARVAQWASIGAGAGAAVVGVFQQLRTMLNGARVSDMSVFFIFALVFGLGGELLSLNACAMRERVSAPPPEKESLLQSLLVIRHNPTLLLISLARFSQGLSPKVQNAYFFENCVSFMNGQTAEFLFGLFGGIPGTLAVFFANKIAAKVGGMKKILIWSQLFSIVLRTLSFFVGFNSLPRFVVITLLISLVNLPGSLMDIAHRTLTSDSIDEIELKTGMRTEGVSFSMQNFTTKMTSGASTLIEGVLLKALHYSSADKVAGKAQNPVFLKWQWPMFCLGPVVGAVLYLIIISFVRDDANRRREVEEQLLARRAAIAEK